MATNLRPARVVAPGKILKRELEARGWTREELAKKLDCTEQIIDEIIEYNKQITPEMAIALSKVIETSPEFWLNLEANYRELPIESK